MCVCVCVGGIVVRHTESLSGTAECAGGQTDTEGLTEEEESFFIFPRLCPCVCVCVCACHTPRAQKHHNSTTAVGWGLGGAEETGEQDGDEEEEEEERLNTRGH